MLRFWAIALAVAAASADGIELPASDIEQTAVVSAKANLEPIGGPDGLDPHRRVATAAVEWLAPEGVVLIETGDAQAQIVEDIFESVGLTASIARDEDLDATVVIGSNTRS